MRHLLTSLATLAIAILVPSEPIQAQQAPRRPAEVARIVAETSGLDEARLSPDGNWAAYTVIRNSIASNEDLHEQWLLRLPKGQEPLPAPVKISVGANGMQWHPDSRSISLLVPAQRPKSSQDKVQRRLMRYDVGTGRLTPIRIRDAAPKKGAQGSRPQITTFEEEYLWSPSGKYIAFTAPLAKRGGLDPRRGVSGATWRAEPLTALFILDVANGDVRQLTPDSVSVNGFAWSPDDKSIAIVYLKSDAPTWDYIFMDIGIADVASRKWRPLVAQPGMDMQPTYSPDGKRIAFISHNGKLQGVRSMLPSIVDGSTAKITTFPEETTPRMGYSHPVWTEDSRALLYRSYQEMTVRLMRADPVTGTATEVPEPTTSLALAHVNERSFSRDQRKMLFIRESPTTPPELFLTALDTQAHPTGPARQLTQLSADFPFSKEVHAEAVQWKGWRGDVVHGILYLPASERDRTGKKPLPTVLHSVNSDAVIFRDFSHSGFFTAPMLAARGYAVLVPNSHYAVGYGTPVRSRKTGPSGLAALIHRQRVPYEDAAAGLDHLIERGITDGTKLGIFGTSSDGTLAMYTVQKTNRFKAAIVHEAHTFEYLTWGSQIPPMSQDHYAVVNLAQHVFVNEEGRVDEQKWREMYDMSPGLFMDRVKTPTLLLFGAKSLADLGRQHANLLGQFGVPHAFFVYDEGHGFHRPAAVADMLTRMGEWLDHYLRGMPYPDVERAREYEHAEGIQ